MAIKILAATPGDAKTIDQIHVASWQRAYRGIVPQEYLDGLGGHWAPLFAENLAAGTFQAKILWEGEVAAGSVAYSGARDKAMGNWGEVISLYIRPEHMKKGYGRRLLETALWDLRSRGYTGCYLWVLEENKNGRGFYERCGFSYNGDADTVVIQDKPLRDLRYVKRFHNDSKENDGGS